MRDLQDYRIHASSEKSVTTGGSAFNIMAESLRLGDFNQREVETLLLEHTAATGQVFTPEALALVWELTQGQPWLVNALAYETTWRNAEGRDPSWPITAAMIQQAKESLIQRRVIHLDQLADKLREPRVRRVVEAILVGDQEPSAIPPDDISYVRDLGLVKTAGQLAMPRKSGGGRSSTAEWRSRCGGVKAVSGYSPCLQHRQQAVEIKVLAAAWLG